MNGVVHVLGVFIDENEMLSIFYYIIDAFVPDVTKYMAGATHPDQAHS